MKLWKTIGLTLKGLFGGEGSTPGGGIVAAATSYQQAPRRGTVELIRAYKRNPWLRTAAYRIASDVAGVPFILYRAKSARAKALTRAHGQARRKLMDGARASGELAAVESHPFLTLLTTMNPALGALASWLVVQIYLDLKGEAFLVLERNALGLPVEAWPVPPHWIVEMPHRGFPFYRASYGTWQKLVPEDDVLHIRSPDPENPYGRGTGIGEALADELDIDELVAKHVKDWFFNNAKPAILVAMKGATETQLDRIEEGWLSKHRGPGKNGQAHFTNAELSVQELSHTFAEQQLGELRGKQRDTVLQVLNIPPECMGIIQNSNRATIDAAYFLYSVGVLCPRLDFLAGSLQELLAEFDERLLLDYVSPVPEDREFKKAVMVALPGNYKRNEHRRLAGAEDLEGPEGDELYTPPPTASPFGALGLAADPPWTKGYRTKGPADGGSGLIRNVLEALRPARLVSEVLPVWKEELQKWGEGVMAELGVAPASFDMRNPLIVEHIEAFAAEKISGLVDETTREALRETLSEGVSAGEGTEELRRRVEETFDEADTSRARTIARTEVVGSSNAANLTAYELSGVVQAKEWLSVRDGQTRDSHRALDGQKVDVRGNFRTPAGRVAPHPGGFGIAEEDINCFPGETLVQAPSRAELVFRRPYSGQMVEVETVAGHKLTGTPNHPVLTQRGWVPLGLLDEADHLVCGPLGDGAGSRADDVDAVPAALAEVFDLALVGGSAKRVKPGAEEQFHGDGSDGEVDVVGVHRELGDRLMPAALQHGPEFALTAAQLGEGALSRDGLSRRLRIADSAQPAPDVRSGGESLSLGPGQLGHADPIGLASSSCGDSRETQRASDGGAGDAQALGDGERAFASLVGLHRLASKRVFDWSGHVFNLQTAGGFYLANGIVAHNCRCSVLPVIEDPKGWKAMDEEQKSAAWRKYDAALAGWEKAAEEALRRGFKAQLKDVLEALR